jgi:hypothetical protein
VDDVPGVQSDRLVASAREWHRLQLAALAFVGLCGVLRGGDSGEVPAWVDSLAGILALVGLALAAVAVVLVALVAWPVTAELARPVAAARRLRVGIWLTFAAVAVTAAASLSGWWPGAGSTAGSVAVSTSSGSACGQVVSGASGWLELQTSSGRVRTPLSEVLSVEPVEAC